MSLLLVATLRDIPGALERMLGLLRRRAFPLERMSLYRIAPDALEVVLHFSASATPGERIEAELRDLVDLTSLRRVEGTAGDEARELALARTRGDPGPWPEALAGVVRGGRTDTIELAGRPEDIDRALAFIDSRGVLAASARSGEIFPPEASGTETLEGGNQR